MLFVLVCSSAELQNILSSVHYVKSNYIVYVHVLLATKPYHLIGVDSKYHDWTHDVLSWWASAVT